MSLGSGRLAREVQRVTATYCYGQSMGLSLDRPGLRIPI
jgi:hypothetical protein